MAAPAFRTASAASVADMGLDYKPSSNLMIRQQVMHGAGTNTTRHYSRAKYQPTHEDENEDENYAEGDEEDAEEGDEEDAEDAEDVEESHELDGKAYLEEDPNLFEHETYVKLRRNFDLLNADEIVSWKVPASSKRIAARVRDNPKFAAYRANVIARLENLAAQYQINLTRKNDIATINVARIHSIIAHKAWKQGVLNFVEYGVEQTDTYETFPASLMPRCILQLLVTGSAPAILLNYIKISEARQKVKYEMQAAAEQDKFKRQMAQQEKLANRGRGGRGGRGRGNGTRVMVSGRGRGGRGGRGGKSQK